MFFADRRTWFGIWRAAMDFLSVFPGEDLQEDA
jgi:hypothetical protein